jgi:predicted transcriptional regulator
MKIKTEAIRIKEECLQRLRELKMRNGASLTFMANKALEEYLKAEENNDTYQRAAEPAVPSWGSTDGVAGK